MVETLAMTLSFKFEPQLFGTNYPMILPAKALERLDALSLDDQALGCNCMINT
jgi:hypothetical protein